MTKEQGTLFDDPPAYVGRVSKHPLYRVWCGMITRCGNPNAHKFKTYGGRGISVCDEWRASRAFVAWALVNGWEPGLQLDRRDNDKGYSPDNCRFVTPSVNGLNRRDTVRLSDGRAAWPLAQRNGVLRPAFAKRLHRGWTPDQAAMIPKGGKRPAATALAVSPAVTEMAIPASDVVQDLKSPKAAVAHHGCALKAVVAFRSIGEIVASLIDAPSGAGDDASIPATACLLCDAAQSAAACDLRAACAHLKGTQNGF